MRGGERALLVAAGLGGAAAVAAGAYASHGLAGLPQEQDWMRTASYFQAIHAVATLAAAALLPRTAGAARLAVAAAGILFVAGSLLFCGTMYALALGTPVPIAMTAPVGGMALIAGWVALAVAGVLPSGG